MFKRVLMAAAVAAAVSAPAFADVSITGSMEMNLMFIDQAGSSNVQTLDRGLQIDFNGADKLDGGGKLIWKLSQKVTSGNTNANSKNALSQQAWGGREGWVGFTGDWGTFKAGRQFLNSYLTLDWPYGQGGNWQLAENNWYAGAAAGKLTANFLTGASLNYQSPSFSGFSFGAQYSWDVVNAATGSRQDGNKFSENYIADLSASYNAGSLGLNAGYLFGKDVAATGDASQYYIGATYGFDFGLNLRALYTGYSQDYATGTQDGYDWIVGGTYGFGKSFIKASYNGSDADGFSGSRAIASAEYGYSLSKNTVAYARYQWRNKEAGDLQYVMFGAWTGF
ncbi:porin [Chitinibacter bivalviorum]|uniref:Porin n=1 Tax=Chitinibacter bivalviorum TaxID=2739434 RepID=A0A7H9BF10_9NEIS|nr:porin [Chitinibacter bivalviorum]QLG86816.1 porin [Chitinibacter bivalviorum]